MTQFTKRNLASRRKRSRSAASGCSVGARLARRAAAELLAGGATGSRARRGTVAARMGVACRAG